MHTIIYLEAMHFNTHQATKYQMLSIVMLHEITITFWNKILFFLMLPRFIFLYIITVKFSFAHTDVLKLHCPYEYQNLYLWKPNIFQTIEIWKILHLVFGHRFLKSCSCFNMYIYKI